MFRRAFLMAAGLAAAAALSALASPRPARAADATAHDFAFANIDGGPLRLADYQGRPILVVNTASFCAFTPQYEGLQALWETYRERGLVVVGVPSQDFNQEYDDAGAVKDFCQVNYGIDFPMADITKVRGTDRHPFFAWAARSFGERNAPRWNFHKYLINGEGRVSAAFGSGVGPASPEITSAIEALLPAG
ncbi:glutathione peroxidase [Rubrimonas cliftonensis]|uniref:Glutathione peroxidase n=1 Tax=Rubrimonas cliftonensis TaxID=89524 RepID=A0A1H3W2F3_9RHOB|nr:glutathione peroxidase [Rubrimonas cliftonensis]SDZ81160.1 glutathione peroxidase [Rubrimonas cliftonensis]